MKNMLLALLASTAFASTAYAQGYYAQPQGGYGGGYGGGYPQQGYAQQQASPYPPPPAGYYGGQQAYQQPAYPQQQQSYVPQPSNMAASAAAPASGNPYQRTNRYNFPYWYIALHAGTTIVRDSDLELGGTGAGEIVFDGGWDFGGAIGYRSYESGPGSFWDLVRFELEYTRHQAGINRISGVSNSTGDITADALMLNAFYDLGRGGWVPYVGVGVGAANLHMTSNTVVTDDTSMQTAYQFMLGATYSPASVPDTDWGIGYRYFGTTDPKFNSATGTPVKHEFDEHSIELLSRFHF